MRQVRLSRERQLDIVAARGAAERTTALWLALRDEGLDCTREYARLLLEGELRYSLSEDKLQAPEFDIRYGEDGEATLVGYHGPDIVICIDADDDTGTLTKPDLRRIHCLSCPPKDGIVVIPSGVTQIRATFLDDQLHYARRIVIPDGVRVIGNYSFRNCFALEEVTIPESVTSIGALAFGGCRNLRHVELPGHLESIGHLAFCRCESLASVVLPDSVGEVGYGAFMGCASLSSVHLPDGLALPPELNIFYGCDALDVTAPRALSTGGWEEARQRLCEALKWFTFQYLDGTNSVYIFMIKGIDEPDASYIGEEVDDDGLEEDVRSFMQPNSWIIRDRSLDIPVLKFRQDTGFAVRAVVDTLRGNGVRVFRDSEDSDESWEYYQDLFRCIVMIGLRLLYVEDKWYAMVFEWSD